MENTKQLEQALHRIAILENALHKISNQHSETWSKDIATKVLSKPNTDSLTDLEKLVIKAILQSDEFDEKHATCIEDLSDNTGVSIKILRGVLSSLVQKNLISLGEYPNGMTAFYYEGN